MSWYNPLTWFTGSSGAGSAVDTVWNYFTGGEFIEDAKDVWNTVDSFLSSDTGQLAQKYLGAQSQGSGVSKLSASAPRADVSATTSTFSPSAASLGFTDRVMQAGRTAYQKAPQGSSIRSTYDAIAARRSQGPLLRLSQSGIDASNRKRKQRA